MSKTIIKLQSPDIISFLKPGSIPSADTRTREILQRKNFARSAECAGGKRYSQSLMGHASSKTTKIYTHVTTKGFDQIKSPLDTLDF